MHAHTHTHNLPNTQTHTHTHTYTDYACVLPGKEGQQQKPQENVQVTAANITIHCPKLYFSSVTFNPVIQLRGTAEY